jgi:hypothetical protein
MLIYDRLQQDLKQQKFVLEVEPTDLVGYPSSQLEPRPRPSME